MTPITSSANETENGSGRSATAGPRHLLRVGELSRALVRACRPRQWLKNLLVFAAPATAGAFGDPRTLLLCAAAFALFCVAASGTYLLNDVRDVHRDREHPRKRRRPVASGDLPVPFAVVTGVLFVTTAPLASLALGDWRLTLLFAGYVLLTLAYTHYLKDVVICDLVAVASCHMLRAMAGGYAAGVELTSWFVIVVALAALLVVVGKREAELRTARPDGPAEPGAPAGHSVCRTRAALHGYTVGYLSQMRVMASGAMVVTYCLWALDQGGGPQSVFHAASIVPFIMFVLRYNLLVDRGAGEEPEEIALRDRPLQLVLVALGLLVGLGIYL
ncbi:decaprenyl-phosphate phosphoribosyltransferase [Nocardiopsis metallicus]|uniref:Decaprenyl-phosphate phosphoribosyltransferase n=1 Tax=Nocardiopsis metallicus TaxID=179819 RepID=A0A840WIW1_9ACTN|nr:decaprenyl-phosphate phosphoribosyltransferase [Nocardiopsis metallicus]MBB5495393.1 decaprenyl-phosphate phosphoribosyltransferase [Nocardiopsis metallicus]